MMITEYGGTCIMNSCSEHNTPPPKKKKGAYPSSSSKHYNTRDKPEGRNSKPIKDKLHAHKENSKKIGLKTNSSQSQTTYMLLRH